MRQVLFFLLLALLFSKSLPANSDSVFMARMDSLAQLMYSNRHDSVRLRINELIHHELAVFLTSVNPITFPFDSLKFLKAVAPDDLSFRMITWAIPCIEEKSFYDGFLQIETENNAFKVIELKAFAGKPELNRTYGVQEWPGAVYYELIENKDKSGRFYTLLGRLQVENGKARRIAETLWFDEDQTPKFGKPVFVMSDNELQHRLVFEFTAEVPFHLAYEKQLLPGKRNKREWMIVFNHLQGNDFSTGRFYKSAIPSYDRFDALIFTKGFWYLHQDIDARAPKTKHSDYHPPEKGLFQERE